MLRQTHTLGEAPEIYRSLQRRLDDLSVPYPATSSGVEIRLLKALFSEEEATIALELSAVPEPLDVICKRLPAYSRRALGKLLAGLSKKGAINSGVTRVGKKRVPTFGLAPLVVGMFEYQVDRLTPEYVKDFHQYLDEGFRSAVVGSKTGQLRTVPVRAEITGGRSVGLYDDIRTYLKQHPGPFSVINCVCRQAAGLLGQSCTTSSTHETCLMIGHVAPIGREVKHDELMEILDRVEREGHVLQPQNARDPAFICCCCKDCCEVLSNARKLSRPADAVPHGFLAGVAPELCTGCRKCLSRCPMEAISIADRVALVDPARCIGCGLCATTCPESAITLKKKRTRRTPRSVGWMHLRMYVERKGWFKLIPVGIKWLFRRKI